MITLPPAFCGDKINVIVETPKGSNNKYVFEPDYGLFRLKKTLPEGFIFPLDFGFIPNTIGGDGDPLDVLVIMDNPGYPGCLVTCNVLGVINVEQTKQGRQSERNDRYLAVASRSLMGTQFMDIDDLGEEYIKQIINFFKGYMEGEGTKFVHVGNLGKDEALEQIKKSLL